MRTHRYNGKEMPRHFRFQGGFRSLGMRDGIVRPTSRLITIIVGAETPDDKENYRPTAPETLKGSYCVCVCHFDDV